MDFVEKSFSGIIRTIIVLGTILIAGYLLIHLIPLAIVAGIIIFAIVKGRKFFQEHFKKSTISKNNKHKNGNVSSENFISNEDLDGEIIDVHYKNV